MGDGDPDEPADSEPDVFESDEADAVTDSEPAAVTDTNEDATTDDTDTTTDDATADDTTATDDDTATDDTATNDGTAADDTTAGEDSVAEDAETDDGGETETGDGDESDPVTVDGTDPVPTPGGFGSASDPPETDAGSPTAGDTTADADPETDTDVETQAADADTDVETQAADADGSVADGGGGVADGSEAGLYSEMDVEDHPPVEQSREGPTEATHTPAAGAPAGGGPPGAAHGGPPEDEEMPLADHIEEMVRRLGVVVLVMAVVSGVVFPFGDRLINILWNNVLPGTDVARPRVYHPLALMLARLKVSTLAGFVVALPVFVYETYLFMKPGLYPRERKYYLAAVPTSLVLAAIGVAFSFFLVLPFIFTYFLNYSEGAANIAFGLTETFNLIVLMLGTFAFIFQIPLFVMLAIMMGITTRRWLESRRVYFWGGFLTLAFLFSPDPTGMAPIMVAVTMVTLFEGTLALLRWTSRGSLVPTPTEAAGARPYVYGLALLAGYLASSAPVPGGYYQQLPGVLRTTLANADLTVAAPLVVGGGILLAYAGLGRLLWRFRNARVILTYRRLRVPVWLGAAAVGYLASPNPALVQRVDQLALDRTVVAGLVVGVVVAYELSLLAYRFQQRHA